MTATSGAPHGREAVREALLEAALKLYARRSPSDVSVRDVARAAGVNHGLVHRYFGSKDALVRAVMTTLSERVAADVAAVEESDRPLAAVQVVARRGYWRVLARALLDDVAPRALQSRFPVMKRLLHEVEEAQRRGALDAGHDPRVLSALAAAMGLGWLLFEPFLLAATGLDAGGKRQARAQAWSTLGELVQKL